MVSTVKITLGNKAEIPANTGWLIIVVLNAWLFILLRIMLQYPAVARQETNLLWQINQWHNMVLNTMSLALAYLGAHSDVLAGWSLGIGWSALLCWLFVQFNLFRFNPF